MRNGLRSLTAVPLAIALGLSGTGCSIKKMAINSLADTLAASGDVFAADNDPELIRDAVPFSLKTIESLLVSVPNHAGLLLSACSGFTQYGYAFVQLDAEALEAKDYQASVAGKDRALKMYLRARDYCFRAMELRHKGVRALLERDPDKALGWTKVSDVPLLYWTGAAWGAAISLGADKPELTIDLPAVRALMTQALRLDNAYSRGAIHEALISLDALPEAIGGSPAGAREHFEKALALTKGLSAGPYVTFASGVSVPSQNKAEFQELLDKALAVDVEREPSMRLANILAQRRARYLLSRMSELFSNAGSGTMAVRPARPSTWPAPAFAPATGASR
jgi:predicted anti-sigma-YlaC factor YlaD